MPLQKIQLRPGVNRENTRYTNEGGYYECDKVRFRQGLPEKIGGWVRDSTNTFLGICRSLGIWSRLNGDVLRGVGTHLKFYLVRGGQYLDITPLRDTVVLNNPFTTVAGSTTITVSGAGGFSNDDFVTFSNANAVGGIDPNGNYQLTANGVNFTIESATPAITSETNGGGAVTAEFEIRSGQALTAPIGGWGAGGWSEGAWGVGIQSDESLRIWNQSPFGENLLFGPQAGALYLWDAANFTLTDPGRGVLISSLPGASDVPLQHNLLIVSDIRRFALVFGTNEVGTVTFDPMLIRWSDQETLLDWTPSATNQAGGIRLSRGSRIVAVIQARQEILVFTDTSVYSLQYTGFGNGVWVPQLVGDNISIANDRSVAYAAGIAYWMGNEKFYMYDGRSQPLSCDLRKFVFNDFNSQQYDQVFGGTLEEFHEIWWFYCSESSTEVDRYVTYNYREGIWYYGNMHRTAWLDSGVNPVPLAATYSQNLVQHETGVDDGEGQSLQPLPAFIESAQFDIEDGDEFAYVKRLIPDVSFEGSSAENPSVDFTLLPLDYPGSGYSSPPSVDLTNTGTVTRTATAPIEQFTPKINIRVRGRQLVMRVESTDIGVAWQLGAQRIEIDVDGRGDGND